MCSILVLPSESGKIELTVHLSAETAATAFGTICCGFYRYQLEIGKNTNIFKTPALAD